jgi:hypothetical protein
MVRIAGQRSVEIGQVSERRRHCCAPESLRNFTVNLSRM